MPDDVPLTEQVLHELRDGVAWITLEPPPRDDGGWFQMGSVDAYTHTKRTAKGRSGPLPYASRKRSLPYRVARWRTRGSRLLSRILDLA